MMPPLPPDRISVLEADRREVLRPGVELDRRPAEAGAVGERAWILNDPQAGRQLPDCAGIASRPGPGRPWPAPVASPLPGRRRA